MNRDELESYLIDAYGALPEHLWARYPSYAVYRHQSNRKWFCVVMTVSKSTLGLGSKDAIDIVNLKCGRGMADLLWQEDGIFPAYHMNKWHWVSVALDGSVQDEMIKELVSSSFELTK